MQSHCLLSYDPKEASKLVFVHAVSLNDVSHGKQAVSDTTLPFPQHIRHIFTPGSEWSSIKQSITSHHITSPTESQLYFYQMIS